MRVNPRVATNLSFLLFFAVALPVGNLLGLVSINTVSVWGRYFCFAMAAMGIDLIWGYMGIMSMCQAFFFWLGGYWVGVDPLVVRKCFTGNQVPAFFDLNGL